MSKADVIKKTDRILRELLQQKGINAQKIIIFGSYAKSMEKEDSDIDVIIVSKDFRNKSIFERVEQTCGIDRELVRRTKKPFDILYYSDEEWENSSSLAINAAKKDGIVIYG
ncbi:TPA: nucleotidyltransferase domain-containing protein [Candidatus Poribacteria bacterium]|nr:nucleotidyltransferase domain-containing protein [Candidatus Poribacteria bacterium]